MIPTRLFLDSIGLLLAADPNGFADPTTFLLVTPIMNAFTPGPDITLADLTVATFTGGGGKHALDATPNLFVDPNTGEQIVQASEPAGGWHWQTTDAVNLPQTIYGYMVTDHTGANLLGTQLFDVPIPLSASGEGFDIGQVQIRISSVSIS